MIPDGTGGPPSHSAAPRPRWVPCQGGERQMIRTRNLLTTLVLLGGLGLSLLATPAARAGLIPNQVTVTPTTGGNYVWSYNVVVTSDVYVQPGDYFTIYDFAGAVPGSATGPAGWTLTTQNSGATPPKTNPA